MLVKPILVCSPPRAQESGCLPRPPSLEGPKLFSPLKNCYKSALLFNSFLWSFSPFCHPQFKNQQILKRKKAGRGDARPFSLESWTFKFLLLWKPWTTISVVLAPWRELYWLFHLFKLHSPLANKPQMSEVMAALETYQCLYIYIYIFFFNQAFLVILSKSFALLQCFTIAKSKIYILHKQWREQFFSSWNHRPLVKREWAVKKTKVEKIPLRKSRKGY